MVVQEDKKPAALDNASNVEVAIQGGKKQRHWTIPAP